MSSNRYCFTLNNYTEDEQTALWGALEAQCKYAIVGREVGESGTRHLQGYCIFNKRCSLRTAKDRLNPRLHVEVSRGSPRQNREYCSKGGDFREHGRAPEGGASPGFCTRDEVARDFLDSVRGGERGLAEFADRRPGAYYFSRHTLLRNYLSSARPIDRPNIRVQWFYGPPGTGKSRKAHEELPEAYIKEPRTKWWNGYKLEEAVIIDDFGPNGIDINHLLRWFDRYKCLVEVKGDMVPLYAVNFIVTSNFHPSGCFKQHVIDYNRVEDHPQLSALMRRINLVCFEYIEQKDERNGGIKKGERREGLPPLINNKKMEGELVNVVCSRDPGASAINTCVLNHFATEPGRSNILWFTHVV